MDTTTILLIVCAVLLGSVAALAVTLFEHKTQLKISQELCNRERFARRSLETELAHLRKLSYGSDRPRYAPNAPAYPSSGIVKANMPTPTYEPDTRPRRSSEPSLVDTSAWSTPTFTSSSSDCSASDTASSSDGGSSCSSGD